MQEIELVQSEAPVANVRSLMQVLGWQKRESTVDTSNPKPETQSAVEIAQPRPLEHAQL